MTNELDVMKVGDKRRVLASGNVPWFTDPDIMLGIHTWWTFSPECLSLRTNLSIRIISSNTKYS